MQGGIGDDTYLVDNTGDTVTEGSGAGIDTVKTILATYSLATDVENLVWTGTAAFSGTGNALNNIDHGRHVERYAQWRWRRRYAQRRRRQ